MLEEGLGMMEDEEGKEDFKKVGKTEGKEIEKLVNVVLMLVVCT
jgi:hypothetical protein